MWGGWSSALIVPQSYRYPAGATLPQVWRRLGVDNFATLANLLDASGSLMDAARHAPPRDEWFSTNSWTFMARFSRGAMRFGS